MMMRNHRDEIPANDLDVDDDQDQEKDDNDDEEDEADDDDDFLTSEQGVGHLLVHLGNPVEKQQSK